MIQTYWNTLWHLTWLLKITFLNGKIHCKWWFSIVVLNNQRVVEMIASLIDINLFFTRTSKLNTCLFSPVNVKPPDNGKENWWFTYWIWGFSIATLNHQKVCWFSGWILWISIGAGPFYHKTQHLMITLPITVFDLMHCHKMEKHIRLVGGAWRMHIYIYLVPPQKKSFYYCSWYLRCFFPESACEGFFVKKQPLYYIFTSADLDLHTFTSADLHLHTLIPADLDLHTFTPADLDLHTFTSADLHLHTFTPADLHLHTFTSADLHLHTLTSADLHLHTPWHLQI